MSTQIGINEKLILYLETIGYRSDAVIDKLVSETTTLGSVAQMQIAPEQGQFLEIIVKISQSINCLEIGRFTGLSALCIAKGLPANGIIIIDNMLWHGDVADKSKTDAPTNTIRDLNKKIQGDERVEFSLLPLSDGLSFIRKK